MSGYAVKSQAGDATSFVESLGAYSRQHRAKHWAGTFEEFLRDIVPPSPRALARSSHEYLWDMLCWFGRSQPDADSGPSALFQRELFGIDAPLARVVDYFKGAAAGSDVGRRLLLLLGPPSGGKSTMAILLKRGIEEYSHTDEGAVYALAGSPLHESPLNIVPATLRAEFREKFGVEIRGEPSPWARDRLEREFEGDFLRMPVERIFLAEASRVGVGTYAPHDPSTADIADLVGSVDLSKVAQFGDEGDPRAWSWSGAVYAASRGVLEMIEILKVKREFLYLLLTLTQEKNVKVSRFPLIHLDETILAHTNLAEFNKFLQEKENEALLDRMVIVRVPVHAVLRRGRPHLPQARVLGAGVPRRAPRSARTARRGGVRRDDTAGQVGARGPRSRQEGADLRRRERRGLYHDRGRAAAAEAPDEGLTGSARASSSTRFRTPSRAATRAA